MNEQMLLSFFDEMGSIQKQAGIGSMITRGIQSFKMAPHLSLGGHGKAIKSLWQSGTAGGKGVVGGLKSLAGSPYGAMAGTAGLGYLAYRGAKSVLGGNRQRQQQGY